MNPESDSHAEDRTVETALRQVRPAAASTAFRQHIRSLAQSAARRRPPISLRLAWAGSGLAACIALACLFLNRRQQSVMESPVPTFPNNENATTASLAESSATFTIASREVALLRRSLAPPVQFVEIQDMELTQSAAGNDSAAPKISFTTRLVPIILKYY